ncbi:MAG TPA: glycosyltransferase family 4 protein [Candidatus Thermoplasmatota archaeon]|nr:glycosyltransferase family 4 protein [Candidatus Thermoplasmatota archaeon]
MRITLVCPYDPSPAQADTAAAVVGGVERVFDQVSRKLAARGHEVTLLCSTDGAAGTAEQEGVQFVRVPRRGTVLRDPVARLAPHLPKDSEVVHVAATYPFTTPSVLRRSHGLGIPAVLDFHFEPTPGGAFGRLALGLYRKVGTPPYRLADAVLVRSLSYGRNAPSLGAIPESRWRILPNGIDPERFRPASGPGGNGGDGDYLLFVGRLVPYKGVEVLLHALAKLRPGLPLHVVGDGPLRASLEALAAHLGVQVRFLGHVEDADLPALYRGARLTLLPSVTGQEAFGISLIESMACGTPVVASALPGVAEVARVGGLVAPPRDADALAAQIRRALEDGLERGPALARRVHAAFSWDVVADRLLEVYGEVACASSR